MHSWVIDWEREHVFESGCFLIQRDIFEYHISGVIFCVLKVFPIGRSIKEGGAFGGVVPNFKNVFPTSRI